ncbi:hypothetical protein FRC07_000299 [Ceratobasidium sp. 392]|nr:hypothetical protein FRC07_000299 [Ceratobasidium sp. 392]
MPYNKKEDVYRYINAKDFFSHLDSDSGSRSYTRVDNVKLEDDPEKRVTHHGCAFRDEDGKIFLVEFMRPTVFRIRFNPEYTDLKQYPDGNSKNLVEDSLTKLIETLDEIEGADWVVDVYDEAHKDFIKLESRPRNRDPENDEYYMRIFIRKKHCQIMAIQPNVKERVTSEIITASKYYEMDKLGESATDVKIVWMTKPKGIMYSGKTTVIEVQKPSMARYLGFGEQGGRQLLKSKVILDYFNYDNMTYSQVYNKGPLESSEPLYHSEPFWMEVAQHYDYHLKVASFVDNFSQVCVDIGSKDNSMIRVAARFNSMRLCVVSGSSISGLINSYTSIVGRPRLKPRYVLGYHQGCYGYDSADRIRAVVNSYREKDFPLDGMHIDVDFQRDHKTFTVDEKMFPNPAAFFAELRAKGVKCGTNITPFINADEDTTYTTLQKGLEKEYFVKDDRCKDNGGPTCANEDRYMVCEGGFERIFRAADSSEEPKSKYKIPDSEPLSKTWNSKQPFRGGVYYGGDLGRPGYYPDLNREAVRRWWGDQYDALIKLGLEFVWQDMTSPCMGLGYGDMKSFPFRLYMSMDAIKDAKNIPIPLPEKVPAIEVWSLYAFNLHRATSKGWNRHPEREGKRNFIIGRGGFIGLHRYAGLWTGDNASTWDFLKVSVAQVLSLGLSGVTISGGDVGGFEPERDWQQWASPELIMRWYCAYSLLPWFRNHYNARFPDKKKFQEPYEFEAHVYEAPDHERWMYYAVLPNADYLDSEYMVGDDLLVAPILERQDDSSELTRTVYLPRPRAWWQCNLRADGPTAAVRLGNKFAGGSLIPYDARINKHAIPWVTPMFIKYGAIIPQIEPRRFVNDVENGPNPIHIHIYPGHKNQKRSYVMYLDDGVSRHSAPRAETIRELSVAHTNFDESDDSAIKEDQPDAFADNQARDVYWKIKISQKIERVEQMMRTIKVTAMHHHVGFDPTKLYGPVFKLVVWAKPKRTEKFGQAKVQIESPGRIVDMEEIYDENKKAWIVELPIKKIAAAKEATLTFTYEA